MKTLVIGLDSATWRIMNPLIKQGEMPNIKKLVDGGASGTLNSTIPPMTPSAWTSIVTGLNPGRHGIYDFLTQDPDTYQIKPVNYSMLNQPAIWDIFNAYNMKVGIMNFPISYPPPKVDSFFISGLASPERENYASPPELTKELRIQGYRIYSRFKPSDGAKIYLDDIKELTDKQCNIAIDLLKKNNWELFWIVFQGLDWIQHYLWNSVIDGESVVDDFYCYMDEIIGRILDESKEDWNVIVLSDHGFNGIDAEIHFNSVLEKWGYLSQVVKPEAVINSKKNYLYQTAENIGRRLPPTIKKWVKKNIPENVNSDLREMHREELSLYKLIDWEKTKAFSFGYMGRIYIHEKGKYPQGTVEPGNESNELKAEIIEKLKSLKNPDTEDPLIGEIYLKEDLYHGEFMDSAPDIQFNLVDFKYMIYNDFNKRWFHAPEGRLADHDMNGIVILRGPGIHQGISVKAETVDITPTILRLHNLHIEEEMDGRVLTEVLSDQVINSQSRGSKKVIIKEKKKHDYNEKEQEEIEKQLGDLGYM